jgi:type IV secretory pathway VirB2 component (pilin)
MQRCIPRIVRMTPAVVLSLLATRPAWAMSGAAGALPWDGPLEAIADYLTGPATHTVARIALIAAALGYGLTGKNGTGVRTLLRVAIGLTLALNAVRIMNFLFG